MRKGNVRGVETVGWIFRHRSSPSEGTLVNEVDQSPTREWNFRVISHCLECLLLDYIHRQATLCSEHLVRIEVSRVEAESTSCLYCIHDDTLEQGGISRLREILNVSISIC